VHTAFSTSSSVRPPGIVHLAALPLMLGSACAAGL